jgi:hypothetical protein
VDRTSAILRPADWTTGKADRLRQIISKVR